MHLCYDCFCEYLSLQMEAVRLKVELTPDAAHWVQAALAAGRFPTAEDAIRHAVNQVKLIELRAELAAAEAEGGSFTTDEVRRYAHDRLDRTPISFNTPTTNSGVTDTLCG
jgi:hypothetical protein